MDMGISKLLGLSVHKLGLIVLILAMALVVIGDQARFGIPPRIDDPAREAGQPLPELPVGLQPAATAPVVDGQDAEAGPADEPGPQSPPGATVMTGYDVAEMYPTSGADGGLPGDTEVFVPLNGEYPDQPVVTVTLMDFLTGQYKIAHAGASGFTIVLSQAQEADRSFSRHVFGPDKTTLQLSNGTAGIGEG